jgi:hypothetical protein
VASASHGHEEIALAREPDRHPDIGDAGAARDERGTAVDRAIPDATGSLVLRVAGPDQLAAELAGEVGECRITEHGRGATVGLERFWRSHGTPPVPRQDDPHRHPGKEQKMDLRRPARLTTLGPP